MGDLCGRLVLWELLFWVESEVFPAHSRGRARIARASVCGLVHSDRLAPRLQDESCFGYWGHYMPMEPFQPA